MNADTKGTEMTAKERRLEIATTLQSQLGQKCFMMIGAKGFAAASSDETHEGGLSFKIGRNAKRVTHISIMLNGEDTYDVEFLNCSLRRKTEPRRILVSCSGVYVDSLHGLIEAHTGMYTSLFGSR